MQGKPKALRKTGVCVVFKRLVSGLLIYGTRLLFGYRGFGHCLRQMGGEVCPKWKQLRGRVGRVASVPGGSVRYTVKRLSYYIGGRIDGLSGRKLRPVLGKLNAIKKNKHVAMMKRGRRL